MAKLISGKILPQQAERPKIEFPCDYPIKVLGATEEGFVDRVLAAIRLHAPDLDVANLRVKDSAKGRFQSITVVIRAQGEAQLEKIFAQLKKIDAVKMVI